MLGDLELVRLARERKNPELVRPALARRAQERLAQERENLVLVRPALERLAQERLAQERLVPAVGSPVRERSLEPVRRVRVRERDRVPGRLAPGASLALESPVVLVRDQVLEKGRGLESPERAKVERAPELVRERVLVRGAREAHRQVAYRVLEVAVTLLVVRVVRVVRVARAVTTSLLSLHVELCWNFLFSILLYISISHIGARLCEQCRYELHLEIKYFSSQIADNIGMAQKRLMCLTFEHRRQPILRPHKRCIPRHSGRVGRIRRTPTVVHAIVRRGNFIVTHPTAAFFRSTGFPPSSPISYRKSAPEWYHCSTPIRSNTVNIPLESGGNARMVCSSCAHL